MSVSSVTDPFCDYPQAPQPVALWSESYAYWAWDEGKDITVYAHFQRHPEKPMLWRGYATVNRGGDIYAVHSYGIQRSPYGPGFEGCYIHVEQPQKLWRLRVEGAAQKRTFTQLTQSVITDGPAVPLTIDIQLSMNSPPWHLVRGKGVSASIMPAHYEQSGRITGWLEIGGERIALDCVGANDHSHGPRNMATLCDGSGFVNGVFPSGRSFTAIQMAPGQYLGYVFEGEGEIQRASRVTIPTPDQYVAGSKGIVELDLGDRTVAIHFQVTSRSVPFTMIAPNFEHIGLTDGERTPLRYYDTSCVLEWGGEVGSGSWQLCRSTG